MPESTKPSWADEVEETNDDLPQTSETFENGLKIVTEYKRNEDDGKKIKIISTYKRESRMVSKSIAKRKTWKKFGLASGDKPGPNPATTIATEEIVMQFITSREEDKPDDDALEKLRSGTLTVIKPHTKYVRPIKTISDKIAKVTSIKGEAWIEPQVIKGKDNNTVYGDGKGFYFCVNSKSINRLQLKCMNYRLGCNCKASIRRDKHNFLMVCRSSHNHARNINYIDECAFINALKDRAKSELTNLKDIYDEESKKYPLAAFKYPYNACNPRMYVARKSAESKEPDNLINAYSESNNILNQENNINPIAQVTSIKDEAWIEPQVIKGKDNNTVYGDGKGFYFHVNSKSINRLHLRCMKYRNGCTSKAYIRTDKNNFLMSGRSLHNHPPNLSYVDECAFINALKDRAIFELTNLKDIYDEESKKYPFAALKYSYNACNTRMSRARKSAESKEPDNLINAYSETDDDTQNILNDNVPNTIEIDSSYIETIDCSEDNIMFIL